MSWQDGLYFGSGQGFDLEIRVDLGGAGGLIPATVSCDVFQGTQRFFWGSFRTSAPDDITTGSDDHLTCAVTHLRGLGAATLSLFQSPAGGRLAELAWANPSFPAGPSLLLNVSEPVPGVMRRLLCEIDRDPGVPFPSAATTLAAPIRTVTVESCLREAGVELVPAPNPTPVFNSPAGGWTVDLLDQLINDATGEFNTVFSSGIAWRAYMALLPSLVGEPRTIGIMPDPARRGAAVFHGTLGITATTPEAVALEYVYTFVHELGHTFNLPHAFDNVAGAPGAGALTFMNYPHVFNDAVAAGTVPGAAAFLQNQRRFFSNFPFRFAPAELLGVRHGDFAFTAMGGDDYVGPFSGLLLPDARAAIPGDDGLQLELRLRPPRRGNIFEFGEPVHVEAQLWVAEDRRAWVEAHLDPTTDYLRLEIERPDGSRTGFDPFLARCVVPEGREMTSAAPQFADLALGVGRKGFTFLEAGQYSVRAVLLRKGAPVLSNILPVYVRYPTPEVENAVVPALTHDVAAYLALGGGAHLGKARDTLATLNDEKPDHPLAQYYRLFEAGIRQRGEEKLSKDRTGFERVKAPDPDPAAFTAAMGISRSRPRAAAGRPTVLSNVTFNKFGRSFYQSLVKNDAGAAAKFLRALVGELQSSRRRVPAERLRQIMSDYDASSGSAAPKAAARKKRK